jgi:hypothetical protein
MRKSSLRASGFLSLVLAASMETTIVEARSPGYLARTGPVPLRFQLPPASEIAALPPLPNDDRPVSSQSPTGENLNPSPSSDAASMVAPESVATALNENTGPETLLPIPADSFTNSAAAISTANDLLIVTPQMLAAYLIPTRGATNTAPIAVIAPIRFTPPAPAHTPPSSRATYRTQ